MDMNEDMRINTSDPMEPKELSNTRATDRRLTPVQPVSAGGYQEHIYKYQNAYRSMKTML